MNYLKYFAFILIVLSLQACEEIIDWRGQYTEIDGLVVNTIITDEYKNQLITLTKPFSGLNDDVKPISGAMVYISEAGNEVHFSESNVNPGNYYSDTKFAASVNTNYHLTIEYKDTTYTADAQAVPGTPAWPFTFEQYLETDSVYIGGIGVDFNENEQAMYVFYIDWSHLYPDGKTSAKLVHYIFNTVNIGQLFGPDREQFIFPKGSLVFQRKYALDPDFAEYLRSLVIETQWKGGFFDETSGNLSSNISGGGLGFFAVCTVQSDTLIAE